MYWKKFLSVSMAAATAFSMGAPMVANAAENANAPTSAITQTNNVATVGAHKAAETAPLILGGELVTGDESSLQDPELAIFGSSYNANPSIYLWNYNYMENGGGKDAPENLTAKKLEKSTAPNMADTFVPANYSTSVTLSMRPNILLGIEDDMMFDENGNDKVPVCRTYDALIAATGMTGYNPTQQAYAPDNWVDLSSMSDLMYTLADEIGVGRYGDASAVAETYEAYAKETQLAILSLLEDAELDKKVVAVLDGTYDATTGKYTVTKYTGEAGRSSNRAAEYLQYTTTNVIDALGLTADKDGKCEVTEDQLKQAKVNCLIFNGMDRGGTLTEEQVTELATNLSTTTSKVNTLIGAPTGAYGLYMNAVDNALAMAVENTFVYEDVFKDELGINMFEMNDAVAFFYDELYHVENADAAETLANQGFSGLKKDGFTVTFDFDGSLSDEIADYEAILEEGFDYYEEQILSGETVPEGLQLSGNLTD